MLYEVITRTIEEGVLDYSMTLYLYSNYLLKDAVYLESFYRRTKYLIVDNLELASISQIDFIMEVSKQLKKSIYLYNTDGSFGIYSYNSEYLEGFLKNVDETVDLGEENPEFLDVLQKNLLLEKNDKIRNNFV